MLTERKVQNLRMGGEEQAELSVGAQGGGNGDKMSYE